MKHLPVYNIQGKLELDKQSLADISELIRESDIAARLLFLISAYADKNNQLITNTKTISVLLGKGINAVNYALNKLNKEGFVDLEIVKLNHKNNMKKCIHDYDLYDESDEEVWQVIKKVKGYKLQLVSEYLRITVNSAVIKVNSDRKNSVLLNIYKRLFYNKDINDNEISNSYWV